jgi:hypothetical protein
MHADGGILGSDSRLLGEVAELSVLEVHDSYGVAIVGLEAGEEAGDTLADFLAEAGVGLRVGGELAAPGFQGSSGNGAVAVMVDYGVAEDSIEPGDHFFVVNRGASFQAAGEGGLEDVFGGGPGFDAAFQEG